MIILPVGVMVVVMGDDEEVAEDEGLEEVTDATMEVVSLAAHLELLMAPELQPADGGIRSPLSSTGCSTIRWRSPATMRTLEALEANHGGSG